jgi:hypothetical protein
MIFVDTQDVIRASRSHRWRHAERLMDGGRNLLHENRATIGSLLAILLDAVTDTRAYQLERPWVTSYSTSPARKDRE